MISFNLKCARGHAFEGWFGSSADFTDQQKDGMVACPLCGDTAIEKALMAPNLAAKGNRAKTQSATPNPNPHVMPDGGGEVAVLPPREKDGDDAAHAYAALRALQKKIKSECDFVGENFAEEARKIHYGEADARKNRKGIYGNARPDEARALAEEGIEVASVPWLPTEN